MQAKLTVLQKLDRYQIVAHAKEGKTDQVIERAQQMLKEDESLVTMSPADWQGIGEMTIQEILAAALAYKRSYEPRPAMAG